MESSFARDGAEIPKPAQYELSEQAVCRTITDYLYDEGGRLAQTTEYCYVGQGESVGESGKMVVWNYDNPQRYSQKKDTLFFYDSQDRLVKTQQQVSGTFGRDFCYVVEYQYRSDGGYAETCSYQGIVAKDAELGEVVKVEYKKTYDAQGKLLSDVTPAQEQNSFYYDYDEEGRLQRVTYRFRSGGEATTAALRYDETGSVSAQSHRSGSYYATWIDHDNEDDNRVASYWYLSAFRDLLEEYSPEEIEGISVPSYLAHYDGERQIDAVTANEWERTLKVNETNTVKRYEFWDYDADGRMLWQYAMGTSDTRLYASQFLYEGDQLRRKVYYGIEGDWKHELYDGSTIEIRRDDDGKVTDITRTGASGDILYRYFFEKDLWGATELASMQEADGTAVDWRTPAKTLAQLDEQRESGTEEELPGGNGGDAFEEDRMVYWVRKGDCLWKIAEKLLHDGSRWPEIYEANRAAVGENPALIFEGMELEIPWN
ncbi:MAG: LysM peptidoglycan-binding domain-containing protein [Muribaculum sp.]|nr:LysM peptidoglycan-binding domain-containing protein [Muribaculum sp.]